MESIASCVDKTRLQTWRCMRVFVYVNHGNQPFAFLSSTLVNIFFILICISIERVTGIEVDTTRITKVKSRVFRNHREPVGDGDIAPPATRLEASRIITVLIIDPTGEISNAFIINIYFLFFIYEDEFFPHVLFPLVNILTSHFDIHTDCWLTIVILRRRDSHGSTYELVDSEAQWREIQERQAGLQQSQTAAVRPAASSSPVQPLPVQQATVRKASNAVNVSTSSVNDSLLDQSHSDLTGIETNSQASSRSRHHRKHRHHHKHRCVFVCDFKE